MEQKIKYFYEVIQDYIGPNKIVVEKKFTNLMPPGENYLSDIQKVNLVLKNTQTEDEEELEVIAKCITEGGGFGMTGHLMKNEINFYKSVVPILQSFQKEHGIPPFKIFPKFIGGRINLTGGDQPDENAVLILENLKLQGYENVDRHIGFNLAQAKRVLEDLAEFHSTALALKLLKPETFQKEIKEKCSMGPPPIPSKEENKPQPQPPNFYPALIRFLKTNGKYSHVVRKFEKFYAYIQEMMKNPAQIFNRPPQEPFNTLVHNDMWLNNTMQIIQDGVISNNKFVDFQMTKVGSITGDLIFFLSSSVQSDILRKEFDNLLEYYYEIFSDTLKKYGCYGVQFSYEKFLDEIKSNIDLPILHCMFMLPGVVFMEKGKAFDIHQDREMRLDEIPQIATERLGILLLKASFRDWI